MSGLKAKGAELLKKEGEKELADFKLRNKEKLDNSILTTKAILEDLIKKNALAKGSFEVLGQGFFDILNEMRIRVSENANKWTRIFANFANSAIAMIESILVKWAALNVLGMIFGGPAFTGISFAASLAMSKGGTVTKAANGIDYTVPNGYPGDSFPVLVQSGERIQVTPANQPTQNEQINHLSNKIEILTSNMIDLISNQNNKLDIGIFGRLDGKDIYLSNKRAGDRYGRMR